MINSLFCFLAWGDYNNSVKKALDVSLLGHKIWIAITIIKYNYIKIIST